MLFSFFLYILADLNQDYLCYQSNHLGFEEKSLGCDQPEQAHLFLTESLIQLHQRSPLEQTSISRNRPPSSGEVSKPWPARRALPISAFASPAMSFGKWGSIRHARSDFLCTYLFFLDATRSIISRINGHVLSIFFSIVGLQYKEVDNIQHSRCIQNSRFALSSKYTLIAAITHSLNKKT